MSSGGQQADSSREMDRLNVGSSISPSVAPIFLLDDEKSQPEKSLPVAVSSPSKKLSYTVGVTEHIVSPGQYNSGIEPHSPAAKDLDLQLQDKPPGNDDELQLDDSAFDLLSLSQTEKHLEQILANLAQGLSQTETNLLAVNYRDGDGPSLDGATPSNTLALSYDLETIAKLQQAILEFQLVQKQLTAAVAAIRKKEAQLVQDRISFAEERARFDRHKLQLIKTLNLSKEQCNLIANMSGDGFKSLYREYRSQAALSAQPTKNNPALSGATGESSTPSQPTSLNVGAVVRQCRANIKGWEVWAKNVYKNPSPKVFFRIENLQKHIVMPLRHNESILNLLYKNPNSTWAWPVFGHFLAKDFNSGAVPKLTATEPKLFFSSLHVQNGAWVQFHGEGTLFGEVTNFAWVLGALLDPTKPSCFVGINDWDLNVSQRKQQAQFIVKIKWEEDS